MREGKCMASKAINLMKEGADEVRIKKKGLLQQNHSSPPHSQWRRRVESLHTQHKKGHTHKKRRGRTTWNRSGGSFSTAHKTRSLTAKKPLLKRSAK
jgi:hypothetical protein